MKFIQFPTICAHNRSADSTANVRTDRIVCVNAASAADRALAREINAVVITDFGGGIRNIV